MSDQDANGFLSRWSKRKSEEDFRESPSLDANRSSEESVTTEKPIPLNTIMDSGISGKMQTTVVADQTMEAESSSPVPAEPEKVLTDVDMPQLETLDASSDYTGFLSPGVSAALKKVALRKLFAGVGFNVRDGLDDYDDDFTKFEGLGDLVTSDMKHQQELAAQREKEKREEEEMLADKKDDENISEEPIESDSEDVIENEANKSHAEAQPPQDQNTVVAEGNEATGTENEEGSIERTKNETG